jgi:hypothetical protein
MPADVEAEAWCDDVIVEDSDSLEKLDGMVAVSWLPGPAMARTSVLGVSSTKRAAVEGGKRLTTHRLGIAVDISNVER